MTTTDEPLRAIVTDAIRYWEPRRITYNLFLGATVLAWVVGTWPSLGPLVGLEGITALLALAALANLLYTTAYLVDLPLQYSALREDWQRWRWLLWLTGTTLAVVLASAVLVGPFYPPGFD